MKLVNRLTVKCDGVRVGDLAMSPDDRKCVFQYDRDWLSDGFSISPLELPLKPELFIADKESFSGNFGIFDDSIPDGYGRYLLSRLLRKQGVEASALTPVQLLSIVGDSGMGALAYFPESFAGEKKALPELDELQRLALGVLSEKSDKDEDVLYFNSGNSGGCRPKCLMTDAEGSWLVKFRHVYDPKDMGIQEYRYNETALKCGIDVPEFKLVDGKYFAARRFDIKDGHRLHVATAGAILGISIRELTMDYRNLLHLTGYLTQDSAQVEQMFRRMVFNVVAENKDDHPKNFSFICEAAKWRLAPAYDLTLCREGYRGQHATSVLGNGNPGTEDMVRAGVDIRIPEKRCREIIDDVTTVCREGLSDLLR